MYGFENAPSSSVELSKYYRYDILVLQLGGNDISFQLSLHALAETIIDFGIYACYIRRISGYICPIFTRHKPGTIGPEVYEKHRVETDSLLELYGETRCHRILAVQTYISQPTLFVHRRRNTLQLLEAGRYIYHNLFCY